MTRPLRLLLVEGSETDACRLLWQLQEGGYAACLARVDSAAGMAAALEQQDWDLVIADYRVPGFSAEAALHLVHEHGLDVPFIILSGTIEQAAAVHMMQAGAQDYILEGDEARILPVIARELREAVRRAAKRAAEEALRASEARFRSLYEHAPIGVVLVDMQGHPLVANKATQRILGYGEDELRRMAFAEFTYADDVAADLALFQEVLAGKRDSYTLEKRYIRKDGHLVWGHLAVSVTRDQSGAPESIIGMLLDVTERREAGERLQQSETRYRRIVETAQEGIWQLDVDNRTSFVNQKMADMLGYTVEEMQGAPLWTFVEADLHGQARGDLAYQRQGATLQAETRLRHRDGRTICAQIASAPLLDPDGHLSGWLGMVSDMTTRKHAEEAVRSRARQQAAVAELGQRALADGDLDALMDATTALMTETFDVECCSVLELLPDGDAFVLRAGTGWQRSVVGQTRTGAGPDSMGGYALLSDGPVIAEDLSAETCFHAAQLLEDGVVGGMSVVIHGSGRAFGALGAFARHRRTFSADDVSFLRAVANVLAQAIQRQKAEEAIRFQAHLLNTVGQAVIATTTEGTITYWNHAAEALYGWSAAEALGRSAMLIVPSSLSAGEGTEIFTRVCAGETWSGEYVVQHRDGHAFPVLVTDVPIRDAQGTVVGIVGVSTDVTERKRAEEAVARHLGHLSALRAIDHAITASLDLRLTLEILLEQAIGQLGMDAADVLLLNRELQVLEFGAGRGLRTPTLHHIALRLGEGLAGHTALERRLVHVPDLAVPDPRLVSGRDFTGEGFVTYLGVPLIAKGEVHGVLELFHRSARRVDEDWLEFVEMLAGQAAIAIDNARLYQGLQRSNMDLALAYDCTLEGWSRALDLRDKETEGHSRRVTGLTLQLARMLGVGEAELVQVRRGALLHDIGKMGIPDSVLLKPGPLTEEEWEVMRRHPVYAYELLAPIAYLRTALEIPYCHHEKWDGTGYPRGLKGEHIPLAARIFAVADVWDALRSDRPYRPAWPADKAREHIRSQAGTHFDPRVVAAFLELGAEELVGLA